MFQKSQGLCGGLWPAEENATPFWKYPVFSHPHPSPLMLRVERAGPGWADWQDSIHSADLWQEKAWLDRATQATAGSSGPAAGPETPLALRRN